VAYAWSVTCDHCQFRQVACLDSHCIYYWLGDDQFAPMPHAGAWCATCGKVTLAEEVPDAARLAERGESWLRLYRDRGVDPGSAHYSRKRQEFANQLVWRSRRIAPSKCLVCRSASVLLLDLAVAGPIELPHPGCRGRLRFDLSHHYHTRPILVYSVEGEFLGPRTREFRPPGSRLPPSESGLWWWVDLGPTGFGSAGTRPDRG
jgi:hypothetical protein